jgi:hypothetical protein
MHKTGDGRVAVLTMADVGALLMWTFLASMTWVGGVLELHDPTSINIEQVEGVLGFLMNKTSNRLQARWTPVML